MLDDETEESTTPAASTPEVRTLPPPLKAVRAECLSCCNGSAYEVSLCPAEACALWPLRFGRRTPDAPRSIVGAIREKCLDCSGGSRAEVRRCRFVDCALHPFRFGTNPNRSRSA
jgi:hypothetical protein